MSNITFRGASIRYADLRQKEEAGVFARIHLTAEISQPVRDAMEWDDLPSCIDSGKLEGILSARHLVMTPNQKELRTHEIQMDCSEVSDFQFFRIRGEDGESSRTELRFIARVVQPGAISVIEEYLRTIGTSPAALKITYTDQQKLDLAATPAEESDEPNCVDCENDVPFMSSSDGDDMLHASGQPCSKKIGNNQKESGTLAPRAVVEGNRRKPQRVPVDHAATEDQSVEDVFEPVN